MCLLNINNSLGVIAVTPLHAVQQYVTYMMVGTGKGEGPPVGSSGITQLWEVHHSNEHMEIEWAYDSVTQPS